MILKILFIVAIIIFVVVGIILFRGLTNINKMIEIEKNDSTKKFLLMKKTDKMNGVIYYVQFICIFGMYFAMLSYKFKLI